MNLSVLIADGSASARESFISAMPEHWGVTLSEASSGTEALEACSSKHPDVLFLDWILPGMNGSEVMEALQRTHTATTVIVMSDGAPDSMKSEARAGGAVAFVEKPIQREAIQSILAACGLMESADEDFASV